MYLPETINELRKLPMPKEPRDTEHDRMIRRSGSLEPSRWIDAVPFRQRVIRLLDAFRLPTPGANGWAGA